MPMITTTQILIALFGVFMTALVVKRSRRHIPVNLPKLPGSSWITGNIPAFIRGENLGDADHECVDKYGMAFWMKGTFNTDILYLADPKGIQHVLNTCGYTFYKMPFILRLVSGPSLFAVEGETHARQRKIMNPGFSHGALKEFVPIFNKIAQKAAGKWRDVVAEEGRSSLVDVYAWLSRTTLDAVGEAAFSYDFGALDDGDSDLLKAYRNVFVDAFHKPSDAELVIGALMGSLPIWTIPYLRSVPVRGMKRLTGFTTAVNKVVHQIVQRETQALDKGLPTGKDIMSLLIKANRSEDSTGKLSDEELFSQMGAIMVAGHDTTASTLVWMFYELSLHPEVQIKLREEIKAARTAAAATGHDELGVAEFESMEYTLAVIKETLRFYPIAAHNIRRAGRDEVIPLSEQFRTASGDQISAIPVREGQRVLMSFWTYNRIKSLWGEDAEQWNPERFLRNRLPDHPKISIGVYANLSTFSSGVHSCIGWRFAVLEMQAVLIALIEDFEVSSPPEELDIKIVRAAAPTLVPMVKGQEKQGIQMPLCITAVN